MATTIKRHRPTAKNKQPVKAAPKLTKQDAEKERRQELSAIASIVGESAVFCHKLADVCDQHTDHVELLFHFPTGIEPYEDIEGKDAEQMKFIREKCIRLEFTAETYFYVFTPNRYEVIASRIDTVIAELTKCAASLRQMKGGDA